MAGNTAKVQKPRTVQFVDVHYPSKGKHLEQFWYGMDGKFLVDRAKKPPYYKYFGKGLWSRFYRVRLEQGTEVMLYKRQHRRHGWQKQRLVGKVLEVLEEGRGFPFRKGGRYGLHTEGNL